MSATEVSLVIGLGFAVVLTLLLVDLGLGVEIQTQNREVGHNVQSAHELQAPVLLERNLLRGLHHEEDDDQVGAMPYQSSLSLRFSVVASAYICGLRAMFAVRL